MALVLSFGLFVDSSNIMAKEKNLNDSYVSDEMLNKQKVDAPKSWGALPTNEQYRYQKEELAAFVHFGPNTFNEIEWGESYGNRTPNDIFRLTEDFDAKTLVSSIKDAGFKKIIVTAKHHDGFCLWASELTDYDVSSATNYKNGQGDILSEISAEATIQDIDMGLYLSPWDIHEPSYGYYDTNGNATTKENDVLDYNDFYSGQLEEILSNDIYGNNGHFTEIWMDGAKGSGANEQDYDFERWYNTIQKYEGEKAGYDSDCMIFQCGSNTTVRWIGNENGYASDTTWSKSKVNKENDSIESNMSGGYSIGYEDGNQWTVPEADARITSGWFWGTKKASPKKLSELADMYFRSVGHNATLLLNIPPNIDGKVDQEILDRLSEFGENINETFEKNLIADVVASNVRGNSLSYSASNTIDGDNDSYWTTDDDKNNGSMIVDLDGIKSFDIVSIEEAIQLGQRINEYKVEYRSNENEEWKLLESGTTIGAKRLIRKQVVRASQLRITVSTNKANIVPIISEIGVFKASDAFELVGSAPDGMEIIDVRDTDTSDGKGFTFNGSWNPENSSIYINGTNTWANAGASGKLTFNGSKVYLLGTRDPNHGKVSISIDGGEAIEVDTNYEKREVGQFLYESDDLVDGSHTLEFTGVSKAMGIEAAYVINNGGKGMIGLERNNYTMNEDETIDVKIIRVGGTLGKASALLQPNPGTAIQDDFNTELISEITFEDGENETTAKVQTRRNTNVTGDQNFTIEIIDESDGLIVGFNQKAKVTIRDTESSKYSALQTLVDEAKTLKKDWYISGFEKMNESLNKAKNLLDSNEVKENEISLAFSELQNAVDELVKREQYSEIDRFSFPWKKDSLATLESEFAVIDNNANNDNGWPCVVVDAKWASNGKYIDAMNEDDKLKFYYCAEKAGTYTAKLTYESGSTKNAISWYEESGKIEPDSIGAGADAVGTRHVVEFEIEVLEPGCGVLVFAGPKGNSPRMDMIEISPKQLSLQTHTITATANDGGTISDIGIKYALEGESVTYDILPYEGYAIKDVKVNEESVGAVTSYTIDDIKMDTTIEVIFEFVHYSENHRFVFPKTNQPEVLEVEYAIIENDESNDNGWPCIVAEDHTWASNGKYVDAINEGDRLLVPYMVENAGTYQAVLSYQSGSTQNAVSWLEQDGKIESGSINAGASSVGTTYTAEFTFTVLTPGEGMLVFVGPKGKSPRMDKIEITKVKVVDTLALEDLISEVESLDSTKYTIESWTKLQETLQTAKEVVANNPTQEAIDSAYETLNNAYTNLKEVIEESVEKKVLKIFIDQVQAAVDSGKVDQLIDGVKDEIYVALAQATVLYENPSATTEEISASIIRLTEALELLDFVKADTTQLQALYDECMTLDLSKYMNGEAKENFKEALDQAKVVLTIEGGALEYEVENAYDQLESALVQLALKPNKDVLAYMIQLAQAKDATADRYTTESYAALLEALAQAKEVYENEDATEQAVSEQVDKLAKAIAQLRLKVDRSYLEKKVKAIKANDFGLYTEESVATLMEIVEETEAFLATPEQSMEEEAVKLEELLKKLDEGLAQLEKKAEVPTDPTEPEQPKPQNPTVPEQSSDASSENSSNESEVSDQIIHASKNTGIKASNNIDTAMVDNKNNENMKELSDAKSIGEKKSKYNNNEKKVPLNAIMKKSQISEIVYFMIGLLGSGIIILLVKRRKKDEKATDKT